MTKILEEGDKVPNFKAQTNSGEIALNDIKEKNIVLYFYPKDMTSGCTIEARDFSALKAEFQKKETIIFGVSKDSLSSHEKFIGKENLNIDLISDSDLKLCKLFGAWQEKSMFGKKYMGIVRQTFLIGKDKKLKKIWRKVTVKGHARNVLESIESFS
jgi:peroxiredoxin Q/BCP